MTDNMVIFFIYIHVLVRCIFDILAASIPTNIEHNVTKMWKSQTSEEDNDVVLEVALAVEALIWSEMSHSC